MDLIKPFLKYRKRDVNLNIAISDKNEKKQFYIMSAPTLNTFSKEEALKNEKTNNVKIVKTLTIECFSLEYILRKYNNNVMPDFLSLDVEGWELEILKSIDLNIYRPKVICVESYDVEGMKKIKRNDLINYIMIYKYSIYADTGMNTILIDSRYVNY